MNGVWRWCFQLYGWAQLSAGSSDAVYEGWNVFRGKECNSVEWSFDWIKNTHETVYFWTRYMVFIIIINNSKNKKER